MFFSMKKLVYLMLVIGFWSCTKTKEAPSVVGNWNAKGVYRTYFSDGKYGDRIYIQGDSINPLLYDSIFGTYYTDSKKSIIHMNPTGYRLKETEQIIIRDGFYESYEYGISNDILTLENEYYSIEFYKQK